MYARIMLENASGLVYERFMKGFFSLFEGMKIMIIHGCIHFFFSVTSMTCYLTWNQKYACFLGERRKENVFDPPCRDIVVSTKLLQSELELKPSLILNRERLPSRRIRNGFHKFMTLPFHFFDSDVQSSCVID